MSSSVSSQALHKLISIPISTQEEWKSLNDPSIPFSLYLDTKVDAKIQRKLDRIQASHEHDIALVVGQFLSLKHLIEDKHFNLGKPTDDGLKMSRLAVKKELRTLKNLQCQTPEIQIIAILYAFEMDKPIAKNEIEEKREGIIHSIEAYRQRFGGHELVIDDGILESIIDAVKPSWGADDAMPKEWLKHILWKRLGRVINPMSKGELDNELIKMRNEENFSFPLELEAIKYGNRHLFFQTQIDNQINLVNKQNRAIALHKKVRNIGLLKLKALANQLHYVSMPGVFESENAKRNSETQLATTLHDIYQRLIHAKGEFLAVNDRPQVINREIPSSELILRLNTLNAKQELQSQDIAAIYGILDELYHRAIGTGKIKRSKDDISDGILHLIIGLESITDKLKTYRTAPKSERVYTKCLEWLEMANAIQPNKPTKPYVEQLISMATPDACRGYLKQLGEQRFANFTGLSEKEKAIQSDRRPGFLSGKSSQQKWEKLIDQKPDDFIKKWLAEILDLTQDLTIIDNLEGRATAKDELVNEIPESMAQKDVEYLLLNQHETYHRIEDLITNMTTDSAIPRSVNQKPYHLFEEEKAKNLKSIKAKHIGEKLYKLRVRKYTKEIQEHLEVFKKLKVYSEPEVKMRLKAVFQINDADTQEQKNQKINRIKELKIGRAGYSLAQMEKIMFDPDLLSRSFEEEVGIPSINVMQDRVSAYKKLLTDIKAVRNDIEQYLYNKSSEIQEAQSKIDNFIQTQQKTMQELRILLYGLIDAKHEGGIHNAFYDIQAAIESKNGQDVTHACLQLVDRLKDTLVNGGFEIEMDGKITYQLEAVIRPLIEPLCAERPLATCAIIDILKNLKNEIKQGYVPQVLYDDTSRETLHNDFSVTLRKNPLQNNEALRTNYSREYYELGTAYKWYVFIQRTILDCNKGQELDQTTAIQILSVLGKIENATHHINRDKATLEAANEEIRSVKMKQIRLTTLDVAWFIGANLNEPMSARLVLDAAHDFIKKDKTNASSYKLFVLNKLFQVAEAYYKNFNEQDKTIFETGIKPDIIHTKFNTTFKDLINTISQTDFPSYARRWKALTGHDEQQFSQTLFLNNKRAEMQGADHLNQVMPLMLKLAQLEHSRNQKTSMTLAKAEQGSERTESEDYLHRIVNVLIDQLNANIQSVPDGQPFEFQIFPSWAFKTKPSGQKIWANGFQDIGPILDTVFQNVFTNPANNLSYQNGKVLIRSKKKVSGKTAKSYIQYPSRPPKWVVSQETPYTNQTIEALSQQFYDKNDDLKNRELDRHWLAEQKEYDAQKKAMKNNKETLKYLNSKKKIPQKLSFFHSQPNPIPPVDPNNDWTSFLTVLHSEDRALFAAYIQNNPEKIPEFKNSFANTTPIPGWKRCSLGLLPYIFEGLGGLEDRKKCIQDILDWAYPKNKKSETELKIEQSLVQARISDSERLQKSLTELIMLFSLDTYTKSSYEPVASKAKSKAEQFLNVLSSNSQSLTEEDVDNITQQTQALVRLKDLIPLTIEAEKVNVSINAIIESQTFQTLSNTYNSTPLFQNINQASKDVVNIIKALNTQIDQASEASKNPLKYLPKNTDGEYVKDLRAIEHLTKTVYAFIQTMEDIHPLQEQMEEHVLLTNMLSETQSDCTSPTIELADTVDLQIEQIQSITHLKNLQIFNANIQEKLESFVQTALNNQPIQNLNQELQDLTRIVAVVRDKLREIEQAYFDEIHKIEEALTRKIESLTHLSDDLDNPELRILADQQKQLATTTVNIIKAVFTEDKTNLPKVEDLQHILGTIQHNVDGLETYQEARRLEQGFEKRTFFSEAFDALADLERLIKPGILNYLGIGQQSNRIAIIPQNSQLSLTQISLASQNSSQPSGSGIRVDRQISNSNLSVISDITAATGFTNISLSGGQVGLVPNQPNSQEPLPTFEDIKNTLIPELKLKLERLTNRAAATIQKTVRRRIAQKVRDKIEKDRENNKMTLEAYQQSLQELKETFSELNTETRSIYNMLLDHLKDLNTQEGLENELKDMERLKLVVDQYRWQKIEEHIEKIDQFPTAPSDKDLIEMPSKVYQYTKVIEKVTQELEQATRILQPVEA